MRTMASVLTKKLGGVRQAIDEEARTATFVYSTNSTDRMGDIIDQASWQLERYMKNPVFLWGHKSRDLPIGRTVDLQVKGGKLIGTVQFAKADEYEFADTCWKMVKGGFLSAVSVGFIPHKYESYSDDSTGAHGYKLFDCELLETSLCPIPCNQDALIGAKDFVGLEAAYRGLLDGYQDDDAGVFQRTELEAICKAFGAGTKEDPTSDFVRDSEGLVSYDQSGERMGILVGGALKMDRTYQDNLRARNLALIGQQAAAQTAATIEKESGPAVNFFLRRAASRGLARRTLLGE